MTPEDLVKILSAVPEKRLAIFELVWGLVGKDGKIDPEKAVFAGEEIQVAIEEAQMVRRENNNLGRELVRWSQATTDLTP